MALRTFYHGSNKIITAPKYAYGDSERDFGAGFYCTENENEARQWACRYPQPGFVNVYNLNTEYLYILDLTSEEYDVMNWVALILKHRQFRIMDSSAERRKNEILSEYLIDITPYDAVVGIRADDSHFALIRSYLSGEFSEDAFKSFIKSEKGNREVFFKNKKCFLMLEYVDSYLAAQRDIYTRYKSDDLLRENIKKAGMTVLDHKYNMGEMIEYVSEACHKNVNDYFKMMALSGLLEEWERKDPGVFYGKSGTETARRVFEKVGVGNKEHPEALVRMVPGVADWAGMMLEYLSESKDISINDIISMVDFDKISEYYPKLYMKPVDEGAEIITKDYVLSDNMSIIQRLRRERGLSQKELAELSGVNLRTLQQYEIKAKDLKKASAEKVVNLAAVLRTTPHRLLE